MHTIMNLKLAIFVTFEVTKRFFVFYLETEDTGADTPIQKNPDVETDEHQD